MEPIQDQNELLALAAQLDLDASLAEANENLIAQAIDRPWEDDKQAEKLLLIQLS